MGMQNTYCNARKLWMRMGVTVKERKVGNVEWVMGLCSAEDLVAL